MNIKRIRDLYIAKNKINFVTDTHKELDYSKWVEYIEQHSDFYIWYEDTPDGMEAKENLGKFSDWVRERMLKRLNKISCYAEYNKTKGSYDINVGFFSEYNYIRIGFERPVTENDLKRFFDMASYLDAYLLSDVRKTIIDEKVIESLE